MSDDDFDDDCDEPACSVCSGEGFGYYDDFGLDPLWYGFDELVNCPSCGGSGLAKYMRYWK